MPAEPHRACINPYQLELTTRGENCRRGSKAKITTAIAEEIRASTDAPADIARKVGLAQCTVSNIRAGRRWSVEHV